MISDCGVASVHSSQIADTSSSMLDVSGNSSITKTPGPKEEKPPNTHPTPTLLDYATKSYFSTAKSKVASTPVLKSEFSSGTSGTPTTAKSITTTPAVTPINTAEDGGEALRSMSMLAGLAAASKILPNKASELSQSKTLESSPPSLAQQASLGFSSEHNPDVMAQFREFAKSFQQENRDSPPALSIESASSSQVSAFKKAWDQANKPKESGNKPKGPSQETVTKVKLQSGTVNVVKVSKPKQVSGALKSVTTNTNTTQSAGNEKLKGHFQPATTASVQSSNIVNAAPFSHQSASMSAILSSMPQHTGGLTSFGDSLPGAGSLSKMQENKLKIQEDQREKLAQLAMKTQIAKPSEKKRQQQQHSYSHEAIISSHTKTHGNTLFSPPSSNTQSQAVHSNQSVRQVSSPVSSSPIQQQQLLKQTVQQQVPRASPSPNRTSPATPPRSSPGTIYSGLTLSQMQAQTLQQQQRTTAATNSQNLWRSVDQSAKVARSPSSAFTLPSGLQRSPAGFSGDHYVSPTRSTGGGTGAASTFPGLHMVGLSKAQQAHDIAASMRSPSSPAHTG